MALLEMRAITKTFPGVRALDDVNLKVEDGEIHALVGENGAVLSSITGNRIGASRKSTIAAQRGLRR